MAPAAHVSLRVGPHQQQAALSEAGHDVRIAGLHGKPGLAPGEPLVGWRRGGCPVEGDDVDASFGELLRPVAGAGPQLDGTGGRRPLDRRQCVVVGNGEREPADGLLAAGR